MKLLTLKGKIFLTIVENVSIFLAAFLNQMIITVFPAYESVKFNESLKEMLNSTTNPNCTMKDPSNSYVTILIGCKYCTELFMFPIVGLIADRYHPPLILFGGLITETLACVVYSSSGDFYITILARVVDGLGNSLVMTSGLTIIYMIYVRDRPRNRLITVDSIVAYIPVCVGPFVAGSIYEFFAVGSETIARWCTFMLLGSLFFVCSLLMVPFAFTDSRLFSKFLFKLKKNRKVDLDQSSEFVESKDDPLRKENNTDLEQSFEFVDSRDGQSTENSIKDIPATVEVQSPFLLLVLLRDKHIMLIVAVLTFNSLVGNSLESTLPIFMIRKFCSDQGEQGIVWLFGIMSIFGFFLSTSLFHLKPTICWVLPIIGLLVNGALCISLYFCPYWWEIGLVLGFIAFFSALTEIVLIPMVPMIIDRKYPTDSYGSGSGLTLITYTISGLIGTFPVGPLVDYLGFLILCIILCGFNCSLVPFIFSFKRIF